MKNEIKKLNQLEHTDSFMQINYLRGFKFVDKAGEIVNKFYTHKDEPPYQMSQRELIIKENVSDTKTFRIAVNNIWCHESNPQNLGNLENEFWKKSQGLLDILEISEVTRIGWRNYFVYKLQNTEEKNKILEKLTPINGAEFSTFTFQKKIGELKSKFIIKGAEKLDDKTPAIIFDIDCSINYEDPLVKIGDIPTQLKNIRETLHSDEMLKIMNSILRKADHNAQVK